MPRPYILVGHSLGGAVVQVYAHEHPEEIAGLVLVDPEDGRLIARLRTRLPAELWKARDKALAEAMPKMPAPIRREQQAMLERSGAEVAAALPLPPVPVVLLSGTKKNPEFPGNPLEQDVKLALHDELVAQDPRIRHVLVPQSRHYIQNDAPDEVVGAIRAVLDEAAKK